VITPGTITNTEEAGVTAESVSSSVPITRMLRFNALGFLCPVAILSIPGRSLAILIDRRALRQTRHQFFQSEFDGNQGGHELMTSAD
jgi:hypothetical protein